MRTYSDEERAAAVRLVAEHGLAEAARQARVPKGTLRNWCDAVGVKRTGSERTRAATEAARERSGELRARLELLLLKKAVELLERMDEPHIEFKGSGPSQVTYPLAPPAAVQHYALSAAILIDKYRLEVGDVTDRRETVSITDGLPPDVKRRLRDTLARLAAEESSGGAEDGVADEAAYGMDPAAPPGTA